MVQCHLVSTCFQEKFKFTFCNVQIEYFSSTVHMRLKFKPFKHLNHKRIWKSMDNERREEKKREDNRSKFSAPHTLYWFVMYFRLYFMRSQTVLNITRCCGVINIVTKGFEFICNDKYYWDFKYENISATVFARKRRATWNVRL